MDARNGRRMEESGWMDGGWEGVVWRMGSGAWWRAQGREMRMDMQGCGKRTRWRMWTHGIWRATCKENAKTGCRKETMRRESSERKTMIEEERRDEKRTKREREREDE